MNNCEASSDLFTSGLDSKAEDFDDDDDGDDEDDDEKDENLDRMSVVHHEDENYDDDQPYN